MHDFPGCDRPIFCVQLLDILSSYLALWRCRIVRFLLDMSQKSGCFCVLRLQFLRCGALSSEDLVHTRELQDLPSKLREKSRKKSRISCEFSQRNVLRILNISQKVVNFDTKFDFRKSSFSSNPDKISGIWHLSLFVPP